MNLQAQRPTRVNWLVIGLVLLATFLIGNFAVSAETNAVADFSTSTLNVDKSNAKTGQTLNYTLAVANSGGDTTTDVTVTNTLPVGMSYVEAASALRPEDNGSVGVVTTNIAINGRVLTWEGIISASRTATFEFSSVVPNSAQLDDILTDNAEVEHSSGDQSLSAATTVVDAAPDISASTFTVDKDIAKAGDRLEYTLMVLNNGDAGTVNVTLPLPNTITYVSGSLMASPAAGVISNPPSFSNGTVTWQFQISFNAKATLTFEADIKESTPINTNIRPTVEIDAGTSVESLTATTRVVEFTNSDIYIPLMSKPFAAPVLSATDPDQDDDDVSWTLTWTSTGSGNRTYLLQEATNEAFTENVVNISKTTRSHTVTKDVGETPAFYYRVKLQSDAGSPFSNVIEIELSGGLSIDKTVINKDNDECTTLRWDFTGIKEFFVNYAEGFDARAAGGTGQTTVCPSVDTTYTAVVVNSDDSVDRFSVFVDVIGSGCNRDPYVERFDSTAGNNPVNSNTKITFFWDFECASEGAYFIGEGGPFGATGDGSREFTVTGDTLFKLTVTKKDSDGKIVFEDNASFTVDVR